MANTPTQIRIDSETKTKANILFKSLGLDMSSAVNIFLRQCILNGGLPFTVEVPNYNQQVLDAMSEAQRISKDTSVPAYDNMQDLINALED